MSANPSLEEKEAARIRALKSRAGGLWPRPLQDSVLSAALLSTGASLLKP
jgi:hypothetical protein